MALSQQLFIYIPSNPRGRFQIFLQKKEDATEHVDEFVLDIGEIVKRTVETDAEERLDVVGFLDNPPELLDEMKQIIEEYREEKMCRQSWFRLWQATVAGLKRSIERSGSKIRYVNMIRFLLRIPHFFSWIGIQTLRNLKEATVEPELDQFMKIGVKWENPFGKKWTKSLESIPPLAKERGVTSRLPLNIWDDREDKWSDGATFESHQTFPLMYMNENSPMTGILLYHFLGKGKSAASIAISRMYPKRKVLVMVPASLRSNYQKEISKFGGSLFRVENEWVFIPVAIKNTTGGWTKLWNPSEDHQEQLPLVGCTPDLDDRLRGFWLPRTYMNRVPNYNLDEIEPIRDTIDSVVSFTTEKRFRIVHYNAGKSTFYQMIRFGLDHSARSSLLMKLKPDADIREEINKLKPDKEKIWNQFSPTLLVNTIVKETYSHPEWNPFYQSVIIVDECHNFISQNMTKLGNLMYTLRMSTHDCRSVLLSGTPIMNHPLESIYLFDYLRGGHITNYIATEQNPSQPWKAGIQHEQIDVGGGRKRLKVHIPLLGWNYMEDGTMVKDETITMDELQRYFGRRMSDGSVIKATNGETVASSRHGIVWGYNSEKKQYVVDQDATLKRFERDILNKQLNGFKPDSDLVQKMTQGNVSYQGKTIGIENNFPTSTTVIENCQMKKYQALIYLMTRIHESEKESRSRVRRGRASQTITLAQNDQRIADAAIQLVAEGTDEGRDDTVSSGMYRIFSRQASNFTFPNYSAYNVYDKQDSDPIADIKKEDCVLKTHPVHSSGGSITSLESNSIKYARAIQNIQESPGLVLMYTFFRVREGIDIVERILQHYGGRAANEPGVINDRLEDDASILLRATHPNPISADQAQYTTKVCVGDLVLKCNPGVNEPVFVTLVKREGDGDITDDTVCTIQQADGELVEGTWRELKLIPFQYGVVSGDEKTDRESMINLFRSRRNKKGVDAAILMITKAGAEGLDLKSVRQVHVLEPFWNEVRIKQVIGRGSRNKSHNYLEPEENNVRNFIYKSILSSSAREMTRLLDQKKSDEEVSKELIGLSPTEATTVKNGNVLDILKLNESTEWNSHLKLLMKQYQDDRMMTSDEFVAKTAERKQILIDQGLKLFIRNSIESTMNLESRYESVPVFISPYTVYQNRNIAIQTYLNEIRDRLMVMRRTLTDEPKGRFKIPVYYVPHLIDSSSAWQEELLEQKVCFTLKRNDALEIKIENPIEEMIQLYKRKAKAHLKGNEIDEIQFKSREEYLDTFPKLITTIFRNIKLDTNLIFMNEKHALDVLKELLMKEKLVGVERSKGTFRRMVDTPKQLCMKKDGSLEMKFSDSVQRFWTSKGFKP